MEVLDLRLVAAAELRPLLEAERVVWRETLRWDFTSTAAMVLRFLEARALSGYAVMEAGQVVGYSFYVIESGKGLIGDAFIHPAFRNGSSEARLMIHILETLQATPGLRRIEAQLLNLNAAGVREHFISLGFQSYERQFLFLSIPDAGEISGANVAAVRMREWDSKWFPAAATLIQDSYRGHVDSAISDQYRTRAGAVRFLENIIRLPGCGTFLPEASFLAFSGENSSGGELFGMVLTSVVSERVAHITQLCVTPNKQGRGLGRRLIGQAVEVLRRKGFQGATLSVTVSNTRATELYRRVGFIPLTNFSAFVWDAPLRSRHINPKKFAVRS